MSSKLSDVIFGLLVTSLLSVVIIGIVTDLNDTYDTTFLSGFGTTTNVANTVANIQTIIDSDNLQNSDFISLTLTFSKLTYETGKIMLGSIGVLITLISKVFSSSTGIVVAPEVIAFLTSIVIFSIAVKFISVVNRGEV